MSGIVGAARLGRGEPPDVLAAMLRAIAHRGPHRADGRRVPGAALGHALLDIGDVGGAGPQPVARGPLLVVADAHLFNRGEVAGAVGESPGASNAELVAAAFETWGTAAPGHLVGDFAVAAWNATTRELILARDPMGVRPLYVHVAEGVALFASDPRGILAALESPPSLDRRSVGEFLLFGTVRSPKRSIYAGIGRVRPGHVLRLTAEGRREDAYWRLTDAPPETWQRAPAAAYRRLLFAAVGHRLPAKPPVAMKLSGGLDSSSVAVVADQILADRGADAPRVVGWTAERLIDDPTGELPWARRLSRESGIQVRPIYADAVAGATVGMPRPQPVAEARPNLQRHLLAQASAGGARVLLTGQGGDLLLSPEPTFFPRLMVRGRWVAAAAAVLAARRSLGRWPPLYLRSWTRARWRRRPWARGRPPPGFPTWLTREAVAAHGLEEMWRATMAGTGARGTGGSHRPHFAHFADAAFWQAVAEYEDPAAVGIPMVARHPLLDPRLLAFARDLPPVPWCVDKCLARQALAGVLPEAIRERPKSRGSPQTAAVALSEAQRSLLAAPWLVQEGFVDGPALEDLAAAYASGEVSAAAFQAVTAVVSFEEWRASTLGAVAAD